MKRTYRYSFILLLLILCSLNLRAQDESNRSREGAGPDQPSLADAEVPGSGLRVRGLRIGYDLASLALLYFEPERRVYSLGFDYEVQQDIYAAAEFGYQAVGIRQANYSYDSDGFYFRLGADVNFLKYEKTNVYEMMYGGLRYGFSNLRHRAYDISVADALYGDLTGAGIPSANVNTHFVSFLGGVRVQLFDKFFMGWAVYANFKLTQTAGQIPAYHVPGFGNGDKRAGIMINYSLAYRIPLQAYKPRKIIKRKEQTQDSVNVPVEE